MGDENLIRKITESDLPLTLAEKEKWNYFLEIPGRVFVGSGELKSSNRALLSDRFSGCQGVAFLGDTYEGALAHNTPAYDPYYFLTGRWSSHMRDFVEDPKEIFHNLSKVSAVHVRHKGRYAWPDSRVEGPLEDIGVGRVVHIPIKSKIPGKDYWRDMVVDVNEKSVYVFPKDHEYGICLRLNDLK